MKLRVENWISLKNFFRHGLGGFKLMENRWGVNMPPKNYDMEANRRKKLERNWMTAAHMTLFAILQMPKMEWKEKWFLFLIAKLKELNKEGIRLSFVQWISSKLHLSTFSVYTIWITPFAPCKHFFHCFVLTTTSRITCFDTKYSLLHVFSILRRFW